MNDFFKDWNYKKHAAFVSSVYAVLYAINMTLSYFIIKKCMDKKFDKKTGAKNEKKTS